MYHTICRSTLFPRSFRLFHMRSHLPPLALVHQCRSRRRPASSTRRHVLYFPQGKAPESVNQGMFFFYYLPWNCTTLPIHPCSGTTLSSVMACRARVAGSGEWMMARVGCCTYDFVLFARSSPRFLSAGCTIVHQDHLVSSPKRNKSITYMSMHP